MQIVLTELPQQVIPGEKYPLTISLVALRNRVVHFKVTLCNRNQEEITSAEAPILSLFEAENPLQPHLMLLYPSNPTINIEVTFPTSLINFQEFVLIKVSAINSPDILPAFSSLVKATIPVLKFHDHTPNPMPDIAPTQPNKALPEIYLTLDPPGLLMHDLPLTFSLRYADDRTLVAVSEENEVGVLFTVSPKGTPCVPTPKIRKVDSKAALTMRVNELSSWHEEDNNGQKFVIEIGTTNPNIAPIVTNPFSVIKEFSGKRTAEEVAEAVPDAPPLPLTKEVLTREIDQMSDTNFQLSGIAWSQTKSILELLYKLEESLASLRINS